ncbi:FHA domain-containing protein [Agromyces sp. ZXT2-6]|uniref:FHA domain-containing protein n=1 Tax=Agromyces sp. ZXT2-6 TaxID=3461153 RepID=UPI004054BBB3
MHRSESGIISVPVPETTDAAATDAAATVAPAVAVAPESGHVTTWPGPPAEAAEGATLPAWELRFSTGEVVTVSGTGLVGRRPMPQPGERFAHLVQIVDRGLSVSKTHLEFGEHDGELWVADRFSSNGTVVRRPGEGGVRCEPGRRMLVPRGSRVEIGEQAFTVD